MVDSQQQKQRTALTAAERALAMLQNASKINGNKRKIVLECSRKRGRPKKKRNDAEASAQEVENLNVQDPLQDALAAIDQNIDEAQVSQKKQYIKWTLNDKKVILEKLQDFKGKATNNPVAATVNYFAKHRGSINGVVYPKHYRNLKEANIRSWIKAKEKVGRRPGRQCVLKPETREAIVQHIKDLLPEEHNSTGLSTRVLSGTVNSTTLIPQIQALIRENGEGDKLDDGSFKVSRTWVNDLCRQLGLSMRSKTQETYKEPNDWREQMAKFKYQIAYVVETRGYSKEDVYNMDQIECPLTARSKRTRAKIGSRNVVVKQKPEKNQLILVPVVSASGEKLPLQFIFQDTEFDKRTMKKCYGSIPDRQTNFRNLKEKYPGCIYNQTDTHWSTLDSNLDLIEHVILPHAEKRWAEKSAKGEATCNQLLLLLDNWKVQPTAEFKSAVEDKFKGKVKLRFLPPNMTHKLQPLDVSINSALKTKTKAVYSFEYGKKIADLISQSTEDDSLAEQIVQIEKRTKPKVKIEDAIDCTYKAWQQIETSLVQKSWLDSTILDAWDVEVQEEALRLFENGLLFPKDPETNRVNVFPDAVPCDAPLQVLDDKATTS